MNMYKINLGQKTSIEKTLIQKGNFFNVVRDINGNFFIDEIQINSLIKNKGWKDAMLAEYVPPVTIMD